MFNILKTVFSNKFFNKKVDLNDLTKLLSVLIIALLILVYAALGENIYVNLNTVVLAVCISLLVLFFLVIEKRRNNPFVIVLSLYILLFYVFRVVTLNAENAEAYAWGLNLMSEKTSNDINYSLFFILLSLFSLYAGLLAVKIKKYEIPFARMKEGNYNIVVTFVIVSFLFSYLYHLTVSFSGGAYLSYYLSVFHPYTVLLFFLVFYVVNNKATDSNNRVLFLFLILFLFLLLITLTGGRKAILALLMYTGIISYVVRGRICFPVKSIVAVALLVAVSFPIYDLSSFYRMERLTNINELNQPLNFLSLFSAYLDKGVMQTQNFSHIFSRLGFLDYEVDSITCSGMYARIINLEYYIKSITAVPLTFIAKPTES